MCYPKLNMVHLLYIENSISRLRESARITDVTLKRKQLHWKQSLFTSAQMLSDYWQQTYRVLSATDFWSSERKWSLHWLEVTAKPPQARPPETAWPENRTQLSSLWICDCPCFHILIMIWRPLEEKRTKENVSIGEINSHSDVCLREIFKPFKMLLLISLWWYSINN